MSSNAKTARLAGLCWLMFVLLTAFSMGYARSGLIVPGDAAATVERISSMDALHRASIAATLWSQVFLFLLGVALFHLFRKASPTGATLLLTSVAISVAVAVASSLGSYAVLALASGPADLAAFSQEQVRALTMLFLRLGNAGQGLLEIFWAPFYIAFGWLVIRSRLIPPALGALLIAMGVGYFFNVFTKLLVPDFHPALITNLAMLLGALGAIPTILWLLVKGAADQGPDEEPPARA